tara:strand:+ start:32199 stop:32507 length:309 start_codon:yes stop_codon:yes gene_type:complete
MLKPSLEQLQALADQNYLVSQIIEWQKKSDSKELIEMGRAFTRCFVYANSLELKEYSYDRIISQFRSAKNNAVLRARKAEEKLDELEAENKDLKEKLKIFGG